MYNYKSVLVLTLVMLCSATNAQVASKGFYFEGIYRANHLTFTPAAFDAVENINLFGLGGGLNTYWGINEKNEVRVSPAFSGELESLKFTGMGGFLKHTVASLSIKLPIHAIFKMGSQSNYSFVGGITPYYGILGGKISSYDHFQYNRFDLTLDGGFSYSFKSKKRIISPEIKYSQSVINGNSKSGVYASTIDVYLRNRISLVVTFRRLKSEN